MSHEALTSRHRPHVVGNPRIAHALEFAIKLGKVDDGDCLWSFRNHRHISEDRRSARYLDTGIELATLKSPSTKIATLFLHHNRRSFTISSHCWTLQSDQDVINLACLRTLTICNHHRRIARSPELLQSPTVKKTNVPRGRKGILLTIN